MDSEIFVEVRIPATASEAIFEWRGRSFSVRVPEATRAFVEIINLAGGRLCLVVERHRRWWQRLSDPSKGEPTASLALVTRRALPRPVA